MMRPTPVLLEVLEARQLLAAQAYDWRNVTMKGTGFINGIVFSPAAPNIVYANTDMGGAYRWDQSTSRWTSLTDWIQTTDWSVNYNGAETIAVDSTDGNRVYLGLGTYNGPGSVLRSTDQGRTWLRTNVPFAMNGNGPGRNAGQRMMVDPNSPNILFYGTRFDGIYKSTDFGATWTKLAGYTFTHDASGVTSEIGTDWLLVDKSSGTPGSASQVLYAGAATTGATKIWRSIDGGTTWAALPGQVLTASNQFPLHGVLTPNGSTLYLTYGVGDVGPNNVSGGFVYKVSNPKTATPTWASIAPSIAQGGWSGVTLDPNNPSTVFISTIDSWGPIDDIYRSTNGGTNWTKLNANNNRNHTSAPYAASNNIHWTGDIQLDPFNPNHAIFNTGFGLYASNNALAATPTWSFFNDGLDQARVNEVASPSNGAVNLLSAIGDQDGFRHVDFSVSPASGRLGQGQGLNVGSNDDIDVAWNNANFVVRATQASPYVQYSNDNGATWAWFPSAGVSGGNSGNGQIAISADGAKTLYEPDGGGQAIYSTRTGSTWSNWTIPATNRPANGAKLVADLVNATTFYAYVGTTLSRSTDGGANWTVMTSAAPSGGMWVRAVAGNAGHLLLSAGGNGLWRSTDGGASWTRINSAAVTISNEVGVGAAAPGGSYPAIFIGGTVNGQVGFHRSDDQGATWTTISDTSHQYGDVLLVQGDPRVYGRLYVGTNGRGVLYADIHNPPAALPSGWATQNIGTVGSSGAAGATDVTATNWEVIGGGSGIAVGGTNDNLRFAYTQLTGDGAITARVTSVSPASPTNNNARAGVMIRETLTANSRTAFVGLTPGSVNGVVFQSRATTGGNTSTASATLGVWPPYWVRLVRVGNTFTAYRSPDGVAWTQLGTTQTIAMGATVQIGLASTASDNNQVNIAKFENVSVVTAPSVAITSVSPDPRGSSVSGIAFTFDQPVVGFDLADLQFTRAGSVISLAGATLNSGDGGTTWTLAGLAPLTGRVGDYVVTIAGDSTANTAGVPLKNAASEAWVMNLLLGTSGNEQMKLVAASATSTDYFLDGAYQYSFNPAALGESLLIDGVGGTDAFVLDGVSVTLASTQRLSALTLDHGATIDIRDHDIVVDYAAATPSPIGAWNGSAYTGLTGEIGAGHIFSSDPLVLEGLAAPAIAEAADVIGINADDSSVWSGYSVDGTTVLIKYTYAGDANLDGMIDAGDYGLIDNYYQFPGTTGQSNGDFNLDGIIDAGDYGLIDNSFQLQGPPL